MSARRNRGKNRARIEFVDVATGQRVRPAPARRSESDGAAPTGRLVADLSGTTIEIDEEDIVGRGVGEHPRETRYDYDVEPYRERAAKKAAEERRSSSRKRSLKKPREIRKTFSSAKKAAEDFYENNALFFDNIGDASDGLRDWMDGIEVRSGKRTRRLSQTPAGEAILRARGSEAQIKRSIAYIFGKARSRRWDAVDWREIERLGAALEPYYEDSERGSRGIYWRPSAAGSRLEQFEEVGVDDREQLAAWEASEEIKEALADLREAYDRTHKCLTPSQRKIVRRRIDEWSRWSADPSKIPDYACDPDESTGGYTCNYPSVSGELRALRRACEHAYDPDWAEPAGRAGEPGFPDLSQGPPDPRKQPLTDKELKSRAACVVGASRRIGKPPIARLVTAACGPDAPTPKEAAKIFSAMGHHARMERLAKRLANP